MMRNLKLDAPLSLRIYNFRKENDTWYATLKFPGQAGLEVQSSPCWSVKHEEGESFQELTPGAKSMLVTKMRQKEKREDKVNE